MHRIGKRTESRLRRLAQLRAEGLGWPAIAEQTGWPEQGCEALTARHAGHWRRLLRDALKSHVLEGLAEGCAILRICLRNTDARVRRTAASSMTNYLRVFGGRRPRPQPGALSKEDQRHLEVLHYVEDMTPEQLDSVVDNYVRHRAREREAAAAISAAAVPVEESERSEVGGDGR